MCLLVVCSCSAGSVCVLVLGLWRVRPCLCSPCGVYVFVVFCCVRVLMVCLWRGRAGGVLVRVIVRVMCLWRMYGGPRTMVVSTEVWMQTYHVSLYQYFAREQLNGRDLVGRFF